MDDLKKYGVRFKYIEGFDYSCWVPVASIDQYRTIRAWLNDSCEAKWNSATASQHIQYSFQNENDCIAFKMVWG